MSNPILREWKQVRAGRASRRQSAFLQPKANHGLAYGSNEKHSPRAAVGCVLGRFPLRHMRHPATSLVPHDSRENG